MTAARGRGRVGLTVLATALALPLAGILGQAPAARASSPAAAGAHTSATPAGVRGPSRCKPMSSRRPHRQVEINSTEDFQGFATTTWVDLECGSVTVQVPKGQQVLVTVWVNAEIRCKGPSERDNACLGRVLADDVELSPVDTTADNVFAWDSADPNLQRWRDGTMIRAGMLSCPAQTSAASCDKKIRVQARNKTDATHFYIDDSIVRAEIDKDAVPVLLPAPGQRGRLRPAGDDRLSAEVKDAGAGNPPFFQLGTHDGGASQQWEPVAHAAGVFLLKTPAIGRCLETTSRLFLWPCDGEKWREQRWQFRDLGDGTFDIYSPATDKCVEQVPMKAGEQLKIAACDKGPAQSWKWTPQTS